MKAEEIMIGKMTNEEAIKYLIAPVATSTEPSAEYLKQKEAYDLAIQALETGEIYITGEDYNLYMRGYKAGKKDFEPKQGKWVTVKQDTILGTFEVKNKVCDQCNHATKYEYPFCPWCGAKMKKGGAE